MLQTRVEIVNDLKITFISFKNEHFEIVLSTLGASIYQLKLPNRDKVFENVVLSFKDYINTFTSGKYPGSTIGPYAGRIYPLDLKINNYIYKLQANNGVNFLHSYKDTYAFKNFDYLIEKDSVIFTLTPNYLHYPGPAKVKVIYQFKGSELTINFETIATQDTYINITNHTYFNLCGNFRRDVLEHQLKLDASHYVGINNNYTPTKLIEIKDTIYDYKEQKPLSSLINSLKSTQTKGIDTAFNFEKHHQLELYDKESGRHLTMSTDYPAVVLYSNNFISKAELLDGIIDFEYAGLAIEPQYLPNEMNLVENPKSFFKKGSKYNHFIRYKFGIKKGE